MVLQKYAKLKQSKTFQLDDEKSFLRLSEGMEHGQGMKKEAKKHGKR